MKYFVYWVTGSCMAGDRNAGLGEFDTLAEAREEVRDILTNRTDAMAVIIEGTELERHT